MKLRLNKKILILTTISLIILTGVTIVFSKMHNTFEFKEYLNDINTLNQYMSSHRPLKLFDLNIEGKNLNKIVFEDCTIGKPHWHEIKIQNSKLINTSIVKGILENIDFSHSKFTNVTFEKVIFNNVLFDYSKLINVKFIDCTFKTGSFYQITSSNVNFEKTNINNGNFRRAEVNLNIKNSKFDDTDFSDLRGSAFVMQNGELKDSIFDSAQFDEFKLNGVYVNRAGGSKCVIPKIHLENCRLDIGFSAANIDNLSLHNNYIESLVTGGDHIKEFNISDCKNAENLRLFRGHIGNLNIKNCTVDALHLGKSEIDKLSLINVSFNKGFSNNLKINNFTLDNVGMTGDIDLSGSIIKNLYIHDFHYDPNAKVKTDGSNLEYNAHGLRLKGVWPEITPDKWLIFHWKDETTK